MGLELVEEGGLRVVEGSPHGPFMSDVEEAGQVVETCLSCGSRMVLLYPDNLTEQFFDLSSGQAGAILQKFRTYGVRLAVVCPPGAVKFSNRFGEVLNEESRGPWFSVFDTRREAVDWLCGNEGNE